TAELFDPATRTWSLTASMGTGRTGATATAIPDGQAWNALVVGGDTLTGQSDVAEEYDLASGQWLGRPNLPANQNRDQHVAVYDPVNHQVIVSGGEHCNTGVCVLLDSVWSHSTVNPNNA